MTRSITICSVVSLFLLGVANSSAYGEVGGSCFDDRQCDQNAGEYCGDDGRCATWNSGGGTYGECRSDQDCRQEVTDHYSFDLGQYCDTSLEPPRCKDLPHEGQPCTRDGRCQNYLSCVRDSGGVSRCRQSEAGQSSSGNNPQGTATEGAVCDPDLDDPFQACAEGLWCDRSYRTCKRLCNAAEGEPAGFPNPQTICDRSNPASDPDNVRANQDRPRGHWCGTDNRCHPYCRAEGGVCEMAIPASARGGMFWCGRKDGREQCLLRCGTGAQGRTLTCDPSANHPSWAGTGWRCGSDGICRQDNPGEVSGIPCSASTQGACGTSAWCDIRASQCRRICEGPQHPENNVCDADIPSSYPPRFYCSNGACWPRKQRGEICDPGVYGLCAAGLWCDGVCKEPSPSGGRCDAGQGNSCQSEYYCNDGICGPQRSCSAGSSCPTGQACMRGWCWHAGGQGAFCDSRIVNSCRAGFICTPWFRCARLRRPGGIAWRGMNEVVGGQRGQCTVSDQTSSAAGGVIGDGSPGGNFGTQIISSPGSSSDDSSTSGGRAPPPAPHDDTCPACNQVSTHAGDDCNKQSQGCDTGSGLTCASYAAATNCVYKVPSDSLGSSYSCPSGDLMSTGECCLVRPACGPNESGCKCKNNIIREFTEGAACGQTGMGKATCDVDSGLKCVKDEPQACNRKVPLPSYPGCEDVVDGQCCLSRGNCAADEAGCFCKRNVSVNPPEGLLQCLTRRGGIPAGFIGLNSDGDECDFPNGARCCAEGLYCGEPDRTIKYNWMANSQTDTCRVGDLGCKCFDQVYNTDQLDSCKFGMCGEKGIRNGKTIPRICALDPNSGNDVGLCRDSRGEFTDLPCQKSDGNPGYVYRCDYENWNSGWVCSGMEIDNRTDNGRSVILEEVLENRGWCKEPSTELRRGPLPMAPPKKPGFTLSPPKSPVPKYVPLKGKGEACSVNTDCQTGLCRSGKCMEMIRLPRYDCSSLSNNFCSGEAGLVCDDSQCLFEANKGPCTSGDQCKSGADLACRAGLCLPRSGAGGVCVLGNDCRTGLSCNAGVCQTPPREKGETCNGGMPCRQGLSCLAGYGSWWRPESRCAQTDVGAGGVCGAHDKCRATFECLRGGGGAESLCYNWNVPLGGACDEVYSYCAGAPHLAQCLDRLCRPPCGPPCRVQENRCVKDVSRVRTWTEACALKTNRRGIRYCPPENGCWSVPADRLACKKTRSENYTETVGCGP